ncbi:MAG: nitroreductase family protein [Anaerovoracaceae bacterium]
MNEIFTRRSIRKFSDQKVSDEKITKILKAAMQAPSAKNQQGWEFIVIKNKAKLLELTGLSPFAGALKTCDFAIVSIVNTDKLIAAIRWQQDLSAAAQNMLLEAHYLGLGAVWLGAAPSPPQADFISEALDLPDNKIPFSVIAFGYPLKTKEAIDRYNPDIITYIE